MNKVGLVVLVIIIIVLGVLLFKKKEPDVIRVPVVIEVPVPGKEGKSDTIYLPSPVKQNPINKELLKQFEESQEKLKLYEEAITERVYEEIFEDSTQTITVTSKTQGKLLEQHLEYKIKPTTVKVDTIIDIPVENIKRLKVYAGAQIGLPIGAEAGIATPALQGNIMIQNKKDNILSLGLDTKGYVWIGYTIKIKL